MLLWEHIKAVDLFIFEKHFTEIPGHSLINQPLPDSQSVTDIEETFGVAHSSGADADSVVIVDDHHRDSLDGKIHSGGKANGTCANDDYRMGNAIYCILVG